MASIDNLSFNQIEIRLESKVSRDNICRRITESGFIKNHNLARKLFLKQYHKQERLQWTKHHMHYRDEWFSVIFSDESKWIIEGPDGFSFYWRNLRKEPKSIFSRRKCGSSLMIWVACAYNDQTYLCFLIGRQNSKYYQEALSKHLLSFCELLDNLDWTFQQNSASIHTFCCT